MAKEIKQLAIINPLANSSSVAFQQSQPGVFVVSALATNKDMLDARVDLWIYNSASTQNLGYVAHGQLIEGRSSFNTEKFTLKANDKIYVRSNSGSVSFVISGVNQTEI